MIRKAKLLKGVAAMAMLDADDLGELIGYQVQSTAEWRREKAKQFPNDCRNERAASELEALSLDIEKLAGSDIHRQLRELSDRFADAAGDDGFVDFEYLNEDVSAELRAIGFHDSYGSGAEFLEWYRDLLQEKLHDLLDQTVPVPDLDQEVENDPAVKAAKHAYDEARAKAYAEARKRL